MLRERSSLDGSPGFIPSAIFCRLRYACLRQQRLECVLPTHSHAHTYTHAHTHTYMNTHTLTHTRTHTHTHSQIHTHTHINTRISLTHTHAHTPQISRASPFLPLLVAPGGLDTVTLLQRRMLLDRSFPTTPPPRTTSTSSPLPSTSNVCQQCATQEPAVTGTISQETAFYEIYYIQYLRG